MKFPRGFTYGEIRRARRVRGALLAECDYEPGLQIRTHAHEHARFNLVLRGALSDSTGAREQEHGSAELIYRTAGEHHRNAVTSRGATCFLVDLPPDWLDRAREEGAVLDRSGAYRGGLLVHLACRVHGEFLQRDEVAPLAIEAILLGMVAEASRRAARAAERRRPPWLERARDLLHASFQERLTLGGIAESVGVHPVHLARVFRAFYGCTLGDYVRQLRLDFVCQQMRVSDSPFVELALAAGFYDQSHFCRLFKRHTGMTPVEYRSLYRAP
jgi:AraC family transcriptional regulator